MYELMITTNANNKKFPSADKNCYIIIDKTENVRSMSSSTFFGIERRFLAMNGDHLSSERAGGTMTLPTYEWNNQRLFPNANQMKPMKCLNCFLNKFLTYTYTVAKNRHSY